jgi:hypothetical protein
VQRARSSCMLTKQRGDSPLGRAQGMLSALVPPPPRWQGDAAAAAAAVMQIKTQSANRKVYTVPHSKRSSWQQPATRGGACTHLLLLRLVLLLQLRRLLHRLCPLLMLRLWLCRCWCWRVRWLSGTCASQTSLPQLLTHNHFEWHVCRVQNSRTCLRVKGCPLLRSALQSDCGVRQMN